MVPSAHGAMLPKELLRLRAKLDAELRLAVSPARPVGDAVAAIGARVPRYRQKLAALVIAANQFASIIAEHGAESRKLVAAARTLARAQGALLARYREARRLRGLDDEKEAFRLLEQWFISPILDYRDWLLELEFALSDPSTAQEPRAVLKFQPIPQIGELGLWLDQRGKSGHARPPDPPRSIAGMLASFVFLVLASAWLMQAPINNYIEQQYHLPSPLARLDEYGLWNAGASSWDGLTQASEAVKAGYAELGARINAPFREPAPVVAARTEAPPTPAEPVSAPAEPAPVPAPEPAPTPLPEPAAAPAVVATAAPATVPADRPKPAARRAVAVAAKPAAEVTVAEEPAPAPAAPPEEPAPAPAEANTAEGPYLHLPRNGKVLFAGDSMMEGIAPHLQRTLKKRFNVSSTNLSKHSTGLSYPSYFNWPRTIAEAIAADRSIRLLVIMLGPNDPWDMPDPAKHGGTYLRFKSPAWEAAYRERVGGIIRDAARSDVRVFWIGVPTMRASKFNEQILWLMQLIESEVQADGAAYLDTRKILAGPDNSYSDTLLINGQNVKMRAADGIHFSVEGQRLLASHILEKIQIDTDAAPPPE